MYEVSPVSRFEMDTADPELAHEWVSRIYAEHTPRLSGSRDGFRMRVDGDVTDMFRIDRLTHTMRARAEAGPPKGLIVLRAPSGRFRVATTRGAVALGPGEMLAMDPEQPMRVSWENVEVETMILDLDASYAVAAELSGLAPERVRFGLSRPLNADQARYWVRTADYVATMLSNRHAPAAPLLRAEAFRALATAAVLVFPNTALDALLDPTSPPAGRDDAAVVRRAVDFIDAHAHEDIGLDDIAAAAGTGPRELRAAFRRHRDQTVWRYLWCARLDGAHHDLRVTRRADGAGAAEQVAAVAARWGFSDPARFAAAYRQTYGRPPEDTLGR